MSSQVLQADPCRQGMLHQIACGLGDQDLSPMSGAHDASGVMHVQTGVVVSAYLRLAGVQAHTHTNGCTFRPGMAGKGLLHLHSSGDSIGSTSKGDEKAVTLCIDFMTGMRLEGTPQQGATVC